MSENLTEIFDRWTEMYPGHSIAAPSFAPTPEGEKLAERVLEEANRQGACMTVLLKTEDRLTVAAVFNDAGLALDMANTGGGKHGMGICDINIPKPLFQRVLDTLKGQKAEAVYAGKSGWDMSIQ